MITAITSARICACCKRELPSENFYFNHRTQIFDKYCKECRKKRSRQYRKECRHAEKDGTLLVITEIDDSILRMELILRALEKIRASILRKRKKMQESECRNFGRDDAFV